MSEMRPQLISFRDWRSSLALLIGVVVGYVNLRFGMKGFFVINNRDTPLILIVILGYVALLPLTITGLFYPRLSSNVLLLVTAAALLFGIISSFSFHAVVYIGTRFVLPNVVVALLFRACATPRSSGSSLTGRVRK
jgi:hypothetical protein